MKIDWHDPSARFDVTSFSNVIVDGRAGPLRTVYGCPRCETQLGFTKDNFEIRAARRLTNLSPEMALLLDEAAGERGLVTHDFLDWSCSNCGLAARAYVRQWAGGRHGDAGTDIVAVAELMGIP